MLLQIEDNEGPLNVDEENNIAIGIDLGTTHTVVSFYKNDALETIEFDGNKLLPSVLSTNENDLIVGRDALLYENAVHSIKREMHNPSVEKAFGKNVVELSGAILKHAKKCAEKEIGQNVSDAVITVPAYFDDTQRQATKDAAKLAGLNVLRLINEPTAAALAYDLDKGKEGAYLIYDLGGGTFDVSLLKLNKGVFHVIATGGDTVLGGDDIDFAILKEMNLKDLPQNRLKARSIKHALSNAEVADGITQKKLEEISAPLIQKTLQISDLVLKDADYHVNDILGVVFVGGSTRLHNLEAKVSQHFGKKVFKDIDPDLCVSYGAALQADALTNRNSDSLLLDVTPLSLGIETMGGLFEKIIHRNTAIPIKKAQDFTTYQDGQTSLKIEVFQGEREMVKDCRSLGKFVLKNIPPMPAGIAKIRVVFSIDADGLLIVSAQELHTQVEHSIDVKPSYGLSREKMEKMLYQSQEFGAQDIEKRLLKESIVQAKHLIKVVEQAIEKDGDLLDSKNFNKAKLNIEKIKHGIDQQDRVIIEAAKEQLTAATQSFAEKRLERAIAKELVGQETDYK